MHAHGLVGRCKAYSEILVIYLDGSKIRYMDTCRANRNSRCFLMDPFLSLLFINFFPGEESVEFLCSG